MDHVHPAIIQSEMDPERVVRVDGVADETIESELEDEGFIELEEEPFPAHEFVPEHTEDLMHRNDHLLLPEKTDQTCRHSCIVGRRMDEIEIFRHLQTLEKGVEHVVIPIMSDSDDSEILPDRFHLRDIAPESRRKDRDLMPFLDESGDEAVEQGFYSPIMRLVELEHEKYLHKFKRLLTGLVYEIILIEVVDHVIFDCIFKGRESS